MMAGQDPILQYLSLWLLIGFRFVGTIFSSPVFTASSLPLAVRFWMALLLAGTAMAGWDGSAPAVLFAAPVALLLACAREFLIGVILGFLSGAPFYALQISGELIGTTMGLSMVSLLDPLSEEQVVIVAQLQFAVGLWFFFRWNGHILLTQALVESLKLLPPGAVNFFKPGDMRLGAWLQSIFNLGVRFTIPYYGALLLADIGLGFLARTVPQMNIFILGLPLKMGLGLFLLMVVFPLTVDLIAPMVDSFLEVALQGIMALR
jgi:flagellar biosynthetic protein FliR